MFLYFWNFMERWYNSRPYVAAGVNYVVNLQSNATSTDDNMQGIFRSTTHNFAWSAEMGISFISINLN
jgi:outer membrane protein W